MEETKEVGEFQTKDFQLAACFMVDGVKYLRVERDKEDTRRLIFIFETNLDIDRIKTERANGTHVVSSVAYDDCLRRLKSIIHEYR